MNSSRPAVLIGERPATPQEEAQTLEQLEKLLRIWAHYPECASVKELLLTLEAKRADQ